MELMVLIEYNVFNDSMSFLVGIAQKISETGFAALSSIDAGFYGKGIYFTTSAMYISHLFYSISRL